jgi:hypothetical protein
MDLHNLILGSGCKRTALSSRSFTPSRLTVSLGLDAPEEKKVSGTCQKGKAGSYIFQPLVLSLYSLSYHGTQNKNLKHIYIRQ